VAMFKAEAEVEVVVVEGAETGGGEEAVGLVGVKVAVEVAVVEAPSVVAPVDVAGVTSVSGRKTFEQFTILGSRRKGTGWLPGSTLSPTTRPNTLFVCLSNPTQIHILTVLS